MKRRTRKDLTIALALALAALGLLLTAGGAEAATLNLKCSGKGEQVKAQEYETAQCVVEAGQKRNIEGVLRNDKNKPVAGTLNVTFSNWEPGSPRKANKAGVAIFTLRGAHGTLGINVDAGELTDLYYLDAKEFTL
jgi:hypothetical protein